MSHFDSEPCEDCPTLCENIAAMGVAWHADWDGGRPRLYAFVSGIILSILSAALSYWIFLKPVSLFNAYNSDGSLRARRRNYWLVPRAFPGTTDRGERPDNDRFHRLTSMATFLIFPAAVLLVSQGRPRHSTFPHRARTHRTPHPTPHPHRGLSPFGATRLVTLTQIVR